MLLLHYVKFHCIGTIEKAVKTFGCEIPTNIHHSIMSIVSQHTLRVRCQKGYKFEISGVVRPKHLSKKNLRYLKCRNSKIVNKYLPKCIRIHNDVHQMSTNHRKENVFRRSERSHLIKDGNNRREDKTFNIHAKGEYKLKVFSNFVTKW